MKKYFTAIILFSASVVMNAQDFLGYSSSNYNGITGVLINPANVVENRMIVDVNLMGFLTATGNNYLGVKHTAFAHSGRLTRDGRKDMKGSKEQGYTPLVYFPAFDDPDFQRKYLTQNNNSKTKSAYLATRVTGPSFLISLNRKNAIGFTSSVRSHFNLDGVSPELATLIFNDFGAGPNDSRNYVDASNLLNKSFKSDIRTTAMVWADYGLTYGHVFRDKDEHYFKAGLTLKLLQGITSAYVNAKNLNFEFDSATIVKNQGLTISNTQISYGHATNLEVANKGKLNDDKSLVDFNPVTGEPTLQYTFGGGFPKFATYPGWGLDIGVVYEWRPKYADYIYEMDGKTGLWRKDKNKYKLKVGLSVTDLGSLKYAKGRIGNNVIIDTTFKFRQLPDNSPYPVYQFDSTIRTLAKYRNETGTYKVGLPTALCLQVDYNIWKDFYVNFTPFIAFQFKNREAQIHDWTNISLAPRWDHKWFGVSLPLSYNAFAAKYDRPMRLGTCIRFGPMIFGTNNLGTFFGSKDLYAADFYFMLKVPVPYHAPRDKDKDKVSDRKDKCKDVPGVWEFMGCPDRDGDHVQDKEDKCPDTPGLKELQGCPDKDGDGITDAEDACPDEKGTLEFKGCPDRDGDKIIDKDDECPDDAGIAEFMGCPDKDGDKTPDKFDLCPDVPGPKEFKGCPDRDGDTVLDKDDGCPDVAGPVENKGCPWPDTDKDGIVDKDDACPTVPGIAQYKGCPPPPPIKPAEQKIIERAFKSLEFATGKDIIVAKSLPSLNELAKLLVQHKNDWTLKLSGHTDNQGSAESNMTLSEKRSKAVKKYLMKKGALDERILTEWFGQTQPIDTNDTPKGRQKNRRVEMKILFAETK